VAIPHPRPETPQIPSPESGAFSFGTCGNCGAQLTGPFCAQCGEKKFSPHDYSVAHLFEEVLDGLTHFDTRFLRTLKVLLSDVLDHVTHHHRYRLYAAARFNSHSHPIE